MIGQFNVDGRSDGEIYLDDATDKEDLAQYAADHGLVQGTKAIVIDTQEVLVLKSDGTWKSWST